MPQRQARRYGGAKGGMAPPERICAPPVFLTDVNESVVGGLNSSYTLIYQFR